MRVLRILALLMAGAAASCGDSTRPSPALGAVGSWIYAYSARTPAACLDTGEARCAGQGILQTVDTNGGLLASSQGRGFCETCRFALDFGPGPVGLAFDQSSLALSLGLCRLTGPMPAEADATVTGEVVCELGDPTGTARGTWTMSRLR